MDKSISQPKGASPKLIIMAISSRKLHEIDTNGRGSLHSAPLDPPIMILVLTEIVVVLLVVVESVLPDVDVSGPGWNAHNLVVTCNNRQTSTLLKCNNR